MDPEVTQSVNLGRGVRERKYKTTVATLHQTTKRTLFCVLIGDLQIFFRRQIQSTCLSVNTFLKSDIHHKAGRNVSVKGKLYVISTNSATNKFISTFLLSDYIYKLTMQSKTQQKHFRRECPHSVQRYSIK